jgi:hypothetical protein
MDMLGSASLVHAGHLDIGGLDGLGDHLSHHHHAAAAARYDYYAHQHAHHAIHQGSHIGHHQPHHPPNQPLPPHRPFTPPGAASLTSLHSSLTNNSHVSTSGVVGGVDPSYSPNSTSHLPTSTVKIKSGIEKCQFL